MTTTRRRVESEAVRKQQILRAARKVLDEKGYDKATISDIVGEAGVAQGTFYLYFDSKKEAVMELARGMIGEMTARTIDKLDPESPFKEQLQFIIQTGFCVADENPDLCRLLHIGAEDVREELKEKMEAEEHPFMVGLAMMFQRGIERGEVVELEPELAVRLLMRMMSGGMTEIHSSGDEEDAKRVSDAMEMLIVNAFVKR